MITYPVELNLAGRRVVVVGGGEVAARKVAGLIEAGASVRIVSPRFSTELPQRQNVTLDARLYEPGCLAGAELVFACTDDRAVNSRVAAEAKAVGIWCNVADDPTACDLFIPAVIRQGSLTIAVGTGGTNPSLAASLRDRLASQFGPEWSILVEELGRARQILKERVADPGIRRQIIETLCTDCSLKLLAARDREAWRSWFERVTESRLKGVRVDPRTE